jgi:cell division transport system permease protein
MVRTLSPKPDKDRVQELRRQKPPVENTEELPMDEGYSKTFLRVIVAVSVFLFAITLAGVLGINSMFENSKKQVVSNFTVQVLPMADYAESKKDLANVVRFFENYPDVVEVVTLSDNELKTLLSPWLGDNVDVNLLPIPKLLDVKIRNAERFDYKELTVRLSEISPQASINDHNLWLSRLLRFVNSLKMLALTILFLVAGAIITAIVYAAKTSLNVHREIIEILHIIGATDGYIAKNYVKQIAGIAVVAGVIGTILAIPAIWLVGNMAHGIEAGIFNSVTFGPEHWLIILLLPLVSALLAAVTAYFTVLKTLKNMV